MDDCNRNEWTPFFIGLGSNQGKREQFLRDALQMLHGQEQMELIQWSSIYETDPVGLKEQPLFLNMVAQGKTSLSAEDLLHHLFMVEKSLYRQRTVRWGPRTIDIDILLYGDISLKTDCLEIPHPRMKERAFVLIPLVEIAPLLRIPPEGQTVREYAKNVPGKGVQKWQKSLKFGEDGFELSAN